MRRAKFVRFICYSVTSLRVQSFQSWKSAGEPNPFVSFDTRRFRRTNRQELVDIFEDHGIHNQRRPARRVVIHDRVS